MVETIEKYERTRHGVMEKLLRFPQPEAINVPRSRFGRQDLSGKPDQRRVEARPPAPSLADRMGEVGVPFGITVIVEHPTLRRDDDVIVAEALARLDPERISIFRRDVIEECGRKDVAGAAGEEDAVR